MGHLVSDEEIKDVIDLLSGVKPCPPATLPKPVQPRIQQHTAVTPQVTTVPHHIRMAGHDTVMHQHIPLTGPTMHLPPHIPPLPAPQSVHRPVSGLNSSPIGRQSSNLLAHPGQLVSSLHGDVPSFYHRPLGAQVSDSVLPVKTNTWPMRPGRGQQVLSMEEISSNHDNQVYEGFCSDLEFSQYVNAVRQRTRKGHHVTNNNPWVAAGDTNTASWSPLMYDRYVVTSLRTFNIIMYKINLKNCCTTV